MRSKWQGLAFLGVFVVSGFSGLVYQSIWTQYLGLFLGHSSHAQSLVLMLFMGGMALGAWLVSRHSERLRRPLLAYAAIELLIGLAGLLFDPAYQQVTSWAYESGFPAAAGSGLAGALRRTLAVCLVLPQCVLLGATFPLMSAGFLRLQPAAEGRVLSGLYFANSIGAAVGALVATYMLLPAIGLPGTILTAGLLNILVAIVIYPLSKAERDVLPLSSEYSAARGAVNVTLVLSVAALTGLTSFVYEITWVRMLSLALGSTLHTFELMLAAFIAGIAFGGLWLRDRADGLREPLKAVGWVQIAMGGAALASLFVYAYAFEWVGWLLRTLARTSEGYVSFNVASGLIALLVMFPAAFFAGMTLPLLTLGLLRSGAGERAIGRVYAVNTLGAIAGVLLAVHILMPFVGVKFALWSAAALDLGLGLILLRKAITLNFNVRRFAPVIVCCIVVLAVSAQVRFDPLVLASSVYRHGTAALVDAKMLFYRDGKAATVAVYEKKQGDSVSRSIATNGKVDAGVIMTLGAVPGADEYTMALLASVPLSMKPSFERVGVIGFGSGMSTHTLLGSRKVGQVDTVEIEPYMIEGARYFEGRVHRAFDDPRSHIVIDDAKSYFAASSIKYDLIVSEPSNPWMGGTASLFTDEFYSFVPRHLTRDGLFVQWIQLYEINPELVSSILRAMLGHFEDVRAYKGSGGDLILVASPNGSVPALAGHAFDEKLLTDELGRLGIYGVGDLEDRFVMGRRELDVYAAIHPVQMNSDFYPILQLEAPASRFKNQRVSDFDDLRNAPWPIVEVFGGRAPGSREDVLPVPNVYADFLAKKHAARELHGMLVEGKPLPRRYASVGDVARVDALRELGAACKLDVVPARSTQMLLSLAMEMVPLLDTVANNEMWGRRAWSKCEPKDTELNHAFAFLEAAGQRDHRRVVIEGKALLDGQGAAKILNDPVASYYVWGSVQTSLVALHEPVLAKQLQQEYASKLPVRVRENSLIRFISALAVVPPGERLVTSPSVAGQSLLK